MRDVARPPSDPRQMRMALGAATASSIFLTTTTDVASMRRVR